MPKYLEFTVRQLYEMFENDAKVLSYLPDLKIKTKMPDRNWTTAVVCSLKPEFMRQTIDYAMRQRMRKGFIKDKSAKVEISAEYLDLLEKVPQVASKYKLIYL